jgi:hypothetical protein
MRMQLECYRVSFLIIVKPGIMTVKTDDVHVHLNIIKLLAIHSTCRRLMVVTVVQLEFGLSQIPVIHRIIDSG